MSNVLITGVTSYPSAAFEIAPIGSAEQVVHLKIHGTFNSTTARLELSYDAGTTWARQNQQGADMFSCTENAVGRITCKGAVQGRLNGSGTPTTLGVMRPSEY